MVFACFALTGEVWTMAKRFETRKTRELSFQPFAWKGTGKYITQN
jgi:hypothetical protein